MILRITLCFDTCITWDMCWYVSRLLVSILIWDDVLSLICWCIHCTWVFGLGFLYMLCICGELDHVLWWGCSELDWDVLRNVPSGECPESCMCLGRQELDWGQRRVAPSATDLSPVGIAMRTWPWDGRFLQHVIRWLCDISGMGFAPWRDNLWLWWYSRTCFLICALAHYFRVLLYDI